MLNGSAAPSGRRLCHSRLFKAAHLADLHAKHVAKRRNHARFNSARGGAAPSTRSSDVTPRSVMPHG